jgi:uncharacterized protein YijF (DUF1287 family)
MSRLPLHRLDIPPRDPLGAAADIVIAALRANGIDPRKAVDNPMCQSLAVEWSRGRMTRVEFDHACRNLLILNPKLAT